MDELSRIERDLRRAQQLLSVQGRCDIYEWPLLVLIVGEADLALRTADDDDVGRLRPLFDEVMADLRDRTSDFRDPEFLSSTRAARRHNPELFRPAR